MQAAAQQFIGPYRLLEPLGQGGMGVVWRAQDERSGRLVALKTVKVPHAGSLAGIRREIHALAQLRHPGIIRIFDDGVEQGIPWYAMELLQGTVLHEHVFGRPKEGLRGEAADWWTITLEGGSQVPAGPGIALSDWSAVGGATIAAPPQKPAPWASAEPRGEPLPPIATSALLESLPRTLSVIRRVCTTLAYLHGEGIVHRDLKPANILIIAASAEQRAASGEPRAARSNEDDGVYPDGSSFGGLGSAFPTPSSSSLAPRSSLPGAAPVSSLAARSSPLAVAGFPVLVDFGLVSQFGGGQGREILQEAGILSGTVAYMAPEQILGEHVDARADLYALGCMLYQLVTGRPPFVGPTQEKVLRAHLHTQPEPPSAWVNGLPGKLDTLVLELLAKRPEDRIGHAETVAAALAELGADQADPEEAPASRAYLYRPRFTGRGKLLETLETSLWQLAAGSGGMLLLGGESGVGKTRLGMELARLATVRGVIVLLGQCEPVDLAGSAPSGRLLQPLRRALQAVADRCREMGEAETRRLLGSSGPLLGLYEPALLALPGQQGLPPPPALPPQAAQERLFRALAGTLQALAESRPVLLVLDDLQWADELTLGLLESLLRAESRAQAPFVILGTYRSEEVTDQLQALLASHGKPILLKRFDADEVGAMVRSMLALPKTPEVFVDFLTRQSEGNPFFVAEYLRSAVEQKLLSRDEAGRWQVAESGEETEQTYAALPQPRSLLELVAARLSRLSAEAQQFVEALSVLGREADADLAADVSGLHSSKVMSATLEAINRQVLEPAEGERLRFVHDKLREVAHSRLEAGRRSELHRAAADALEQAPAEQRQELLAELGRHWEQAGEPSRAQPCYLAAARRATEAYALQEAETRYRAYLRLVQPPTLESLEARYELGIKVLEMRGRSEVALREFDLMVEEAQALGERRLEGEALQQMGWMHQKTGRSDVALQLYEQALAIHREVGNRHGEGTALASLAILHVEMGKPEQGRLLHERALAIHREVGNRPSEGRALNNLASLLRELGQKEQARPLFEEALAINREVGDLHSEGRTLSNLGILHFELDQMEQARLHWEQALAIHREVGNRRSEAIVLGNLGILHRTLGSPEQARLVWQQALAIQREVGNRRLAGMLLMDLAGLELLAWGNLTRAAELTEEADRSRPSVEDSFWVVNLLCHQGHIALASGRSSRDELERAEGLVNGLQAGPESPIFREVAILSRSVGAFEAGQHGRLFRGHWVEDIPEGLRRWLRETGQLGAESDSGELRMDAGDLASGTT